MPSGDEWQLLRDDDNGEVPLYRFRDVSHRLGEYAEMCRYHQISLDSGFTKRWLCSLATPEGRITLTNGRLITTSGGSRHETVISTEAEVRHCLLERFGIEFPESVDLSKLVS
jgi:N-hydroxyarylamine O-acetyltransferase